MADIEDLCKQNEEEPKKVGRSLMIGRVFQDTRDGIPGKKIPKPLNAFEDEEVMEAIIEALVRENPQGKKSMDKFVNKMRKEHKMSFGNAAVLHGYRTMLEMGRIEQNLKIEKLLRAKTGRGQSGVIVITVMTARYPKSGQKIEKFSCKYNCHYCPDEPGQPRSYLHDEPSVLRANRCGFDAVEQVLDRAHSYLVNGHPVDKVELLVLGGTWSSYSKEYQEEFIRDLYYACNILHCDEHRERLSLDEEIKFNESSKCHMIGLTLETRPDQIWRKELQSFRRFGVTRVQIGLQHTKDDILDKINRQCSAEDGKVGIRRLKNAGFKVDIHLMPDLPGSSPELDKEMFGEVLYDPDWQADQWKIYPCSVVPWTKIQEWHQTGEYMPYAEADPKQLFELLIWVKTNVHPWIRLNRVVRDIPNQYIEGGNDVTNLRQYLMAEMKRRDQVCWCMRCREVKGREFGEMYMCVRKYEASGGTEYFLSFESNDNMVLYGFLRLRLCYDWTEMEETFPELVGCAMIRELHVYGEVTEVGDGGQATQHRGLGKKLLQKAERIAWDNGFRKISVISGVGVKNYYRKNGFQDQGNYGYLIKHVSRPMHWYAGICFAVLLCIFVFCMLMGIN